MGSTMAQTDKPYVLKRQIGETHHYLTHVNNGGTWSLQDATEFNPETCLWYSGPVFNVSGTHHNYYFYDQTADKYHFLSAPLAGNQDLGFSAELPTTSHLKNPEEIYYFYDWDQDEYGGGVARGHDDNGWWTVHWVSYSNHYHKWLTSEDHYNVVDSAARYREVTITEHDKYFNWTQNNIGNLEEPFAMNWHETPSSNGHALSITIGNYSYTCTPAYTTYNFEGSSYNFQGNTPYTPTPSSPIQGSGSAASYTWTILGEGNDYLSFSSEPNSNDTVTTGATPTLYYTRENTQGRKTATLTLTMTFGSGDNIATVVRTTTVTVNTLCQNPAQAANPVVNHNDVTVTWYPTASHYKVEWKKASESDWTHASYAEVGDVTSYTIHDLDQVLYQYRVIAKCGDDYQTPPTNPTGSFTPQAAPDLLIYGSVFGGGRAADVTGKVEVIIVNCDSIGAVYGGNDIAGTAGGADGAIITLGVNGSGTAPHTQAPIRIGSVYGGGNGYYAYGSQAFAPATATTNTVAAGASVYAMSLSNQWDNLVWTNSGTTAVSKPSISKTSITVTNDYVKIDSLFGGAKNAFVTQNKANDDDVTTTNTKTTINGGTIFAVFGGNNVGGTLGTARQKIDVTATTEDRDPVTGTIKLGRTHGIGYLFGGGNMVAGTTTEVNITGGQLDTIFGGGNRESVVAAWLTVNCAGDKKISSALDGSGNILSTYGWDGDALYNVHTLFGGNNRAHMDGVPHITLTSGGVGTAYGGGNAGDMLAHIHEQIEENGPYVDYGTHMVLSEDNMIVDFLYGGCQMSNVEYSTWVEIQGGHVGSVYGGCNVSGDVGSIRTDPEATAFTGEEPNQEPNENYQKVKGATYVKVTGGTIYRDVFAGSNGYYHCNDGVYYVEGLKFGDQDGSPEYYDPNNLYVGLRVPTHNETNVKICGGTIKGNVYAGGNLACVGFTDYTVPEEFTSGDKLYPTFVGLTLVEMSGGHVEGDVYGGGRMASVFGSNSVKVSGGTIDGALYGGNDRTGQVAQITNRVLSDDYKWASDNITNLNQLNVKTYVCVMGAPQVGTVYGGGNGDYDYTSEDAIQFCGITPDEPIQSNTFVDINIDGSANGHTAGHIGTVYGGGNGVTVINGITVFLNVQNVDYEHDGDHVGTIFGGNNKGSLTLVPDIILKDGKVHTVYGGCNKGAMYGDYTFKTGSGNSEHTYPNVGSLVRLRDQYVFTLKGGQYNAQNEWIANNTDYTQPVHAQVTGAVYGGCRMNGVTTNSMVLVEGHGNDHVNAELFGGSDISGVVGGTSMVVINGVNTTSGDLIATQVGNVYGGGNGHYVYENNNVYVLNDDGTTGDLIDQGTALNPIQAPYCKETLVEMINGNSDHNLFAGGYAALSGKTTMNVYGGTVNEKIFGGGNLAGTTKASYTFEGNSYSGDGTSTVNVTGGMVKGGVYGGNNLQGTIADDITVNILGGTFGTSTVPMTDGIFGGGYGNQTRTTGDVTVNVDKVSGGVAPVIYGDVYGGSGYGDVNTEDGNDITMVNILDGTIHGDIYGGGLGQNQIGDDPTTAYPAKVNGKVYVNIGSGELNQGCVENLTGNATIGGAVYGCNNINGTPLDDVFVNIYSTHHEGNNVYPTNPPTTVVGLSALPHTDDYFALSAVYGGGNRAAYLPPLNGENRRCATVHVWGCHENTIKDVYGGGNAADVGSTGTNGVAANTHVIIDGGRIYRSFGGGNGYSAIGNHNDPSGQDYNPGANIYGKASSHIYSGLIEEVYGGANQYGSIDDIDLNVLSSSCCQDKAVYCKVFGCANEAPINHDIVTTIGCGVGEIGELYGGSNLAPIGVNDPNHKANVTLNLYGGEYERVFGGSKGRLEGGGLSAVSADIYGDVTLNLYGGTVHDAFGGSDQLGSIKGIITVNVLDDEGSCKLDLTNVYGGSNLADYDPWTVNGAVVESPIVNVMHINNVDVVGEQQVMQGIRGNVFGGGYQATVTSKPVVNIGYDAETVVYGTTTMAQLKPEGYPEESTLTNFPLAYITGDVFGGGDEANVSGKATVNMRQAQSRVTKIFGGGNEAGVGATEVNVYNGKVATAVYGGCNTKGNVTNDVAVNVYGGTLGTTTNPISIFGGGYGGPVPADNNPGTTTGGNVIVTIGGTGYTPTIYGPVYGGSALGSVNAAGKFTKVELKSGTVNGNVFGGGLGNNTTAAIVNGDIQVVGNGGNVNGLVFGANDQNGDPAGKVEVVINGGTITGDVFGGGNVAAYSSPIVNNNYTNYPYVNITGGTVTHKVVGGGNNANVVGNPFILIEGGTIGINDASDAGIYGGCNTWGTVTGNTIVTLTGGSIGEEVNTGTLEDPEYVVHHAYIHGGGYGKDTYVTGNVTVSFGAVEINESTGEEVHTDDLVLYGELYGGSALGNVNTNIENNSDLKTIVNLMNGIIIGEVYGGGLGRLDDQSTTDENEAVAATVFGEVHVNVGSATNQFDDETFRGMADLADCEVFGGNNVNGTPKKDIFVDVFKTYHTTKDYVSYTEGDATYAISQVFGGGNRSNYLPEGTDNTINMYFHLCDNTVRRVFGGGNAATVPSVNLTFDGGRYDYIFGGGNGEDNAAAVAGNVTIIYGGVNSHYMFGGCNQSGQVEEPNQNVGVGGTVTMNHITNSYCDELTIEFFFLGGNETPVNEDINATFTCAKNDRYVNVYCGCNLAPINGNINVTIEGGTFDRVFGGSRGSDTYPSNISGDVNLIITGGTIGALYGGCDLNGNIDGKINIEVYENENSSCPLFIGDIYGAGNHTDYTPEPDNLGGAYSPKVKILKGVIGGTSENLPVKVGNPSTFVGNVFGGGNEGNVGTSVKPSNPKVIVGDGSATTSVTINGNVFGGGNEGNVTGSPMVVVVPETHTLTINQPENASSGVVRVYNSLGEIVTSGTVTLGEDLDMRIEAIPSIYGYKFNGWSVTANTGSSVDSPTSASSIFTMGTDDTSLEASFVAATCHNLSLVTIPESGGGSFTVKDRLGNDVDTTQGISEGAVLYLEATPAANYTFQGWNVTGEGSSVVSSTSATTTFIMGTSGTSTITATFVPSSGSGRHRRR